ncbi:hypothetical protein ABZ826_22460 [Streptomyces sp. NPDC047515]|uniref:hypothetical protein n=1 Tax=Streptomyces sp. NPDC047515 TaxID=3155380 RepID=UPI0033D5C75A
MIDRLWYVVDYVSSVACGQLCDSTGGSTPAKRSADYVVADDELGDINHAAYGLFDGLEPGGKHANAASETAGTSGVGDTAEVGAASRPKRCPRRTATTGPR